MTDKKLSILICGCHAQNNVPVGLGPIPVANPRTVGDQKNDESGTTFGDGEYC